MRCCGVGNPTSPSCPESRLSCAYLLLLLLLLSGGEAPSTSYLQTRCLWRCCSSDPAIPAEPFTHAHTQSVLHSDNRVPITAFSSNACVGVQVSQVVWSLWCLSFHSCRLAFCTYTMLTIRGDCNLRGIYPHCVLLSVKTNSATIATPLMTVFTISRECYCT